uniref:HECT domain-containing protein n=1 Tax=Strigamia maritima TaxID=126957 RepID=T1J2Q6_STRMM
MSNSGMDTAQWLAINEDVLFLHDGLNRITDLVDLPSDMNSEDTEHEVFTFDTKNPGELSDRILHACSRQNNAYVRLFQYRLNAVKGLWTAQKQVAIELSEKETNSISIPDETLNLLKKQGLWQSTEAASFSSRVSLLLVFPLLQSQSKTDPELCGITTELLLQCLRECPPLSLNKEPADCLNGLEKLLCHWLDVDDANDLKNEVSHRETVAAALVSLACARGTSKTLLHTVHLLQNMPDLGSLQVADVLKKLLELEGGIGGLSSVIGAKHMLCWDFEDFLSFPLNRENNEKVKDTDYRRCIAGDGKFIYSTNCVGYNLAKIGSGYHGTLRGCIYAKNINIGPGLIAWGDGYLLFRSYAFDCDKDLNQFALVINQYTLQPQNKVTIPLTSIPETNVTTIQFCSDSLYFYWVWIPTSFNDKNAKGVPEKEFELTNVQSRVILTRKEDTVNKSLNDALLARLRPYRSVTTTALVTVTGSSSTAVPPVDATFNTSCGLPLKALTRAPIYTCGTTIVFLTTIPGASVSTTARSLFGSGSNLAALRALASNLCFNISDGQFITRNDLIDAPTCSLSRGATLQELGVCYDSLNNIIWLCSNHWIDQFYNPGQQSLHHLNFQLGIDHLPLSPSTDNRIALPEVIRQLMVHVGTMSCHTLTGEYSSVQVNIMRTHKPHPVDLDHLRWTLDILDVALRASDNTIINCGLIVLQVIFKSCVFKLESAAELLLMKRVSCVAWNLISSHPNASSFRVSSHGHQKRIGIQAEACNVINNALYVLYPLPRDRHNLLLQLFSDGIPASYLRNLILIQYTEQLQNLNLNFDDAKKVRVNDEVLNLLLKTVVKESGVLLRTCNISNRSKFEQVLTSTPLMSPPLRYLAAYQNHLLRAAVMFDAPADDPTTNPPECLETIRQCLSTFICQVMNGMYEVLEVVLEVFSQLVNGGVSDFDFWLTGLERIIKSTMLGHLLPTLMTCLTHNNLLCLRLSDDVLSHLVPLVTIVSQAALLMKNQAQTIQPVTPPADIEVTNVAIDHVEEAGFLSGLKVPAPWATGRTVESIHPVRDNYKFKEVVQIPGARCLYLRFDPRCSSQYDYDKLSVYAGPNTNSKKITEYGGNTMGFGSRSVLGSGWPKDLVKIDGDTVTFSFEMRSGREHNTPDKAMWGFLITVRAQESPEEMSNGLPFLADLALGLSIVSTKLLEILFRGPFISIDEIACSSLLHSHLLQSLMSVWFSPNDFPTFSTGENGGPDAITPFLVGEEILKKLRQLSGCSAPQLRPSLKDAIQANLLEENIVACVLKHLKLGDDVKELNTLEESKSQEYVFLTEVVQETYRKLDSIIRRLQVLGDLEQQWENAKIDVSNSDLFFADYHIIESKHKDLALLCFLKQVDFTGLTLEECVNALKFKLNADMTYSTEDLPKNGDWTDSLKRPGYSRSVSAPPNLEGSDQELFPIKLQSNKQRKHASYPWHISSLSQDEGHKTDKTVQNPPHFVFLDQLFRFIGSSPRENVSCEKFLNAAKIRNERGHSRRKALIRIKELLTAASRVGGATHLVAAVTPVLQNGPKIEELHCGGLGTSVREAFAEAMQSIVQLASRYPIACCNNIGLLCIVPYTRSEEKCLIQSGLVHLLDRLCSLSSCHSTGTNNSLTVRQQVSALAWAGFQVLSNRCVMWEQEEEGLLCDRPEHSGLANQVATLLTNHLARATKNDGNEAVNGETLQEVLSLLNNLSRSRLGKAILSQPPCVSKLLSLLLDHRPSPKLVLVILQLCHVALPLMSAEDCTKVELPSWGCDIHLEESETQNNSEEPSVQIARLLLTKLGEYVIPGCRTKLSTESANDDGGSDDLLLSAKSSSKDQAGKCETQDGKLSVFIHKREDQTCHEIIQPLLSSDSRLFRGGCGGNMEKVVRMDRELTKTGKMEVCTEDVSTACRRAFKWAQAGLVVSTGPPTEGLGMDQTSDKKKNSADVYCKEKNAELAKTDPVRTFVSGHVANSMASEVIALLHSLLSTTTDEIWVSSVEKVIATALALLPKVIKLSEHIGTSHCNLKKLMSMACQVDAALCALGGFKESIKPGSEVSIVGKGIVRSRGHVVSLSEEQGIATASLILPTDGMPYSRANDVVQVPISRLKPTKNKPFSLKCKTLTEQLVKVLNELLVSDNKGSKSPLQMPLPPSSEGNVFAMAVCRVISEIRTRACMVLMQHIDNKQFATAFMQQSSRAIDVLKSLSKDCNPGHRLRVIETQCERLRMFYRDYAKPPLPPSKLNGRTKQITWDPSRSCPPVRACVLSYGLSAITFLGEPSMASGLPRGTFVYATQNIPQQAPSFYWEIEMCSLGESQDDNGPIISFGFAPAAEKKDGAWTNPVGTVLFHNNGRAVHYNGSSLLQWKSIRLDITLSPGDICGCGWERTGDSSEFPSQQVKGTVFFTHNGQRLPSLLDDVSGGLYPVVHIQKKLDLQHTRIRANFGTRKFAYAEGQSHRNAANEAADSTEEISANFGILPFHGSSDSESDSSDKFNASTDSVEVPSSQRIACRIATNPKPLREYNSDVSLNYKLPLSYMNFTVTGPSGVTTTGNGNQDPDSDTESIDGKSQQEDHYALLVKAWESKVFPVIRRRFRNEAERKDGLEQIRGALQLGMTDIARQTVEFLYEENGGMPRDLHLPTIEDIKEEVAKFSIDKMRKGMAVLITNPSSTASGATVLPKWAVHSMLRTFGLVGIVLDIDTQLELVQVETYLNSEGILIRYWYPVEILERPLPGHQRGNLKGSQVLDISNIQIHRELLQCELILVKSYCRHSLLKLIDHCNSPDFSTESTSLSTAMAASAALLQELDVENLQLLSNELLAHPSPAGIVSELSLDQCQNLSQALNFNSCTATTLFYEENDWLQKELASAIDRAAKQGEDYLMELTSQICVCLQLAPESFPCEEFIIGETKVVTDLLFPGAAFLVVSCKFNPKMTKREGLAASKNFWSRIYSYCGHQIKKNGQVSKQEIVSYPNLSSSDNQMTYPAVLIPCNCIHVRLGGCSPPPGMIVSVHGIPPQLPLALAYIEVLLSAKYQELTWNNKSDKEPSTKTSFSENEKNNPVLITTSVLLHVVELLGNYLWRTDIPAIIKERIFHLLAQVLRTLHYSEDTSDDPSFFPTLGAHLSPSLALLLQLQSELRKLYEEETKTWISSGTPSGVGMGLGVGDQGRFSSYFHCLMEVSLAVAEVTSPITPGLCNSGGLGLAVSLQGGGSSPPPSAAPASPSASTKRKKLKAKRDRDRMSPKSRSGSSSPRSSICEGEHSVLPISSIDKPEDSLWFHRALTMSQILRYLVDGDPQGSAVTADAISDASQSLVSPTLPSRLLVITGIPNYLTQEDVKKNVRSALASCGGLYRDEVFVPSEMIKSTDKSSDEEIIGGSSEKKKCIKGFAVIEVRSRAKLDTAHKILTQSKFLVGSGNLDEMSNDLAEHMLSISTVNQSLQTSNTDDVVALEMYLQSKMLFNIDSTDLCDAALTALTEIFHSCFLGEQRLSFMETKHVSGFICLSKDQIMSQSQGNLLLTFLNNSKGSKRNLCEQVTSVLSQYGLSKLKDKEDFSTDETAFDESKEQKILQHKKSKLKTSIHEKEDYNVSGEKSHRQSSPAKSEKQGKDSDSEMERTDEQPADSEEKFLTLDGLAQYVCDRVQHDVRSVWLSFLACGYDFHFERCSCADTSVAQNLSKQWTLEMDTALSVYVNGLCRHLAITPARLHPHEIYVSPAELSSVEFSCLQGVPMESVRLRFALLQFLNNSLETFFLPLVDLRPSKYFPHSTASLLTRGCGLIFYDTKVTLMNRVLNATVQRKLDQAAPEIILDPLEMIGNELKHVTNTQFCQALQQLADIPSTQLCVRLASGGDPTYSFNIRPIGEEVLGTISKELQGQWLNLLIPCSSGVVNVNKGKFILQSGPMTYSEEKLLQFFGQLLGITIRADIPLPLDLLPCVWKSLLSIPIDSDSDLKEADYLTYNFIKKFSLVENMNDMKVLLEEYNSPTFLYTTLSGEEVELMPNGRNIPVTWANHRQYIDSVRSLRISELEAEDRMNAIKAGLASVIPLQLLCLLTPSDMDLRTCGVPEIDLNFLKAHTMYQVGLMETDRHIQFFWNTLESFSQNELRKFIKFACSQDRIPNTCPCKDGQSDTLHVPPYPMKIAPPDGKPGSPDSRYIRVETCIFMIKLPQYSTQEVMSERLLYAIHCREDPLRMPMYGIFFGIHYASKLSIIFYFYIGFQALLPPLFTPLAGGAILLSLFGIPLNLIPTFFITSYNFVLLITHSVLISIEIKQFVYKSRNFTKWMASIIEENEILEGNEISLAKMDVNGSCILHPAVILGIRPGITL